ncbi:MAG: helix-turn-helix domain-containing protein [Brooklawnia sp.]|uniref:helix-turn-helix domain-containing protein n=1 Tax=Brooklawnia sp. TaxID=2699740 RepID=UPI003C751EDA
MNSAAQDAETFVPEDQTEAEVLDFIAALKARGLDAPEARARLVSKDGTETIDLPDKVFRALKFVAENLAEGRAVTVAPIETLMTTQEAAEFLGMSRPSLIKIIERGDLACTKVGRHRRLRLGDVLKYQRSMADTRRRALDEMAAIAREHGLYGATSQSPEGIR